MKVEVGDTVRIAFEGKFKDGKVFEKSVEGIPLEFKVGSEEVIEGLEKAVLGMEFDDSKSVEIPCDEAYGPRRDDLVIAVPQHTLGKGLNPAIGEVLMMKFPDGDEVPASVRNVTPDAVIMDANPPFAGKDLVFEITVVGIDKA